MDELPPCHNCGHEISHHLTLAGEKTCCDWCCEDDDEVCGCHHYEPATPEDFLDQEAI